MSSEPLQFLIYVMNEPVCTIPPVILPFTDCLVFTVGVARSFNLSAISRCNLSIAPVADIAVFIFIRGVQAGNLSAALTNDSLRYVTYKWTPQPNQIGSQQMCVVAYIR